MDLKFRKLKANEIDVRIGTISYNKPKVKESGIKGASYLLYKDARVDMALLDEVVGPLNWQRTHEFKDGKLYCNVGIFDEKNSHWVWKEDVGVESNTEAEKGQASDSFKRACFNWGIGRELYTAPFIYIRQADVDEDLSYLKLFVKEIDYTNDEISKLVLVDNKGNTIYTYGVKTQNKLKIEPKKEVQQPTQPNEPLATKEQTDYIASFGEPAVKWVFSRYKIDALSKLTLSQATEIIDGIKKGKK